MDHSQSIRLDDIRAYRESYESNPISRVTTRAVSKTNVDEVCYDAERVRKMGHKFSVDVPTMGATNQKSSSRCWIYSSLNILREKVAKDLNLEYFELSQNFVSFYDHLEKSNSFLERVIETALEPTDDRYVQMLMSTPVAEGGWWEFFVGLCRKYGVVPAEVMPENKQSSHSASVNMLINMQLRQDAITLRTEIAAGKDAETVRGLKNEMLSRIYNILAICLGNPPETFDFEYVDKDRNYHCDRNLTPHTFYEKYIGRNVENIVSIMNAPTPTKPFYKAYILSGNDSIYGDVPVKFLNLPLDEFKQAIIRQLQDQDLVWFAADCYPYGDFDAGIWDTEMYDYATPFGLDVHLDKGQLLDYRESNPNHAMVLTGVNLVDGKPDKWKVQNSWGTEKADKGYYVMSDEWFSRYVFTACVDLKYLTDDQRGYLKEEPVILPPWDVLG